ncbi:hypothetical protein ABIE65_000930 [Constrictibacter sp. MBR-5]
MPLGSDVHASSAQEASAAHEAPVSHPSPGPPGEGLPFWGPAAARVVPRRHCERTEAIQGPRTHLQSRLHCRRGRIGRDRMRTFAPVWALSIEDSGVQYSGGRRLRSSHFAYSPASLTYFFSSSAYTRASLMYSLTAFLKLDITQASHVWVRFRSSTHDGIEGFDGLDRADGGDGSLQYAAAGPDAAIASAHTASAKQPLRMVCRRCLHHRCSLLNRTLGPPPFSTVNATPADSRRAPPAP